MTLVSEVAMKPFAQFRAECNKQLEILGLAIASIVREDTGERIYGIVRFS